ncbi:glycosyltransferase family protein [Butyrivibrio proteoclasticus]|uniref:glycosyltransferase family protein n=1 Tax=Butyrivibrio proteoclasticus TaxID=43305 RepID=UPI000B188612|nr:DUF3880 domain-containing protein [Butyrivibrio proteoclasticus]
MNVLLLDMFGSFLIGDMCYCFDKLGVHYHYIQHLLKNKERDEGFEKRISGELRKCSYDMVFSTNYYPILARICYGEGVPYCAWEYDSPPEITSLETLDYPTNRIFFFCRFDYEKFRNEYGLDTVYYLPLGVNIERLQKIKPDLRYESDVSLVGGLYDSESFLELRSIMSPEQQQLMDAVVNVQLQHSGSTVLDAALTDEIVRQICEHYRSLSDKAIQPTKEQLFFSLSSHITHMERLALLRISATKGYDTRLYIPSVSDANKELLTKCGVKICGAVSYDQEMPQVFKSCKINLCPTVRANRTGIPLRIVDVLGAGGFLLSSHQAELDDFFEKDELATYECVEEAMDKISFYLTHENERLKVAGKAHERVEKDFRFEDRVKVILDSL